MIATPRNAGPAVLAECICSRETQSQREDRQRRNRRRAEMCEPPELGPASCERFTCERCVRSVPACFGGDGDELCDDCFAQAEALLDVSSR